MPANHSYTLGRPLVTIYLKGPFCSRPENQQYDTQSLMYGRHSEHSRTWLRPLPRFTNCIRLIYTIYEKPLGFGSVFSPSRSFSHQRT